MKKYTILYCSNCRTSKNESKSFNTHKVFVVFFLVVAVFFSPQVSLFQQRGGDSALSLPAAYGSEIPTQSNPSTEGILPTTDFSATIKQRIRQNITKQIMQTAPQMQQSKIMTTPSPICGRPWRFPLAQVQGIISNVEYRVQPLTGQRGLHLDVETGQQADTVIHVYPERLTAKCPSVFHFNVGDTVYVTGSEFFTGKGEMQQNICAAVITQGEKEISVRDRRTGALKNQLCCQEICEKNCIGFPSMCDRMCMGNCQNKRLQAVFQNIPFCPSCNEEYKTATY